MVAHDTLMRESIRDSRGTKPRVDSGGEWQDRGAASLSDLLVARQRSFCHLTMMSYNSLLRQGARPRRIRELAS